MYTKKQQLVMGADPYMKLILKKYLLPYTFFSPRHSLSEAVGVFRGFEFSQEKLLSEILTYDVTKFGTQFSVPFYIFQGEHDILSPEPIAKEYFDQVKAPRKDFANIKDAGHFAMIVQPEQFLRLLLTIK